MFGLSLYTTERDLREVFSKYGPIADVSIVYDQQSRRSRGFAFVYFENVDDAKEVSEYLLVLLFWFYIIDLRPKTYNYSFEFLLFGGILKIFCLEHVEFSDVLNLLSALHCKKKNQV